MSEGTHPEIQPKGLLQYDEFMKQEGGKSDRQLLLGISYAVYMARQQSHANGLAIVALRERVDEIENQANEAMASLTTPEAMMSMADKFLGGKG
jgi:hypothetical protein